MLDVENVKCETIFLKMSWLWLKNVLFFQKYKVSSFIVSELDVFEEKFSLIKRKYHECCTTDAIVQHYTM